MEDAAYPLVILETSIVYITFSTKESKSLKNKIMRKV